MATRVLLLGLMGAGKTTVGTALARALGVPYLDNDRMLQAATGHELYSVYTERGLAGLHDLEWRTLNALLETPPPWVGAAAAAVVVDPRFGAALEARRPFVVWLRATVDTLLRRVHGGEGRPALAPDPRAALAGMVQERSALYASVSDAIVDVDTATVAETVAVIQQKMAETGAPRPGDG